MQFFKIVNGVVELARDEISIYPTIKTIISRDKGGKVSGDHDGRKKIYAYRELTYVYLMCDYNAYPTQHGLSNKEAHRYAVEHSQLEPNYEPDEVIKLLMVQYEKEHISSAKQSARNILRLFGWNNKIIEAIDNNLTNMMSNATLTKDQIAELIGYQKQLLDISINIPTHAKRLREAMTLLEEEDRSIKIGRGGNEISSSMNPDNDIEN
jgi:hypothetical protein